MDLSHYAPLALIVLVACLGDVVFGFAGAVKSGTVSSSKMRDGLWHKFGLMGLFALAVGLEAAMGYVDLGFTAPIAPVATGYIACMEVVSILENITVLTPELKGSRLERLFRSAAVDEAAGGDGEEASE